LAVFEAVKVLATWTDAVIIWWVLAAFRAAKEK
jgi:hypothetical protein